MVKPRGLVLSDSPQLSLESNFDLTFSNTGGTIKALYPNLSTHLDLAIDGTFDSNGGDKWQGSLCPTFQG